MFHELWKVPGMFKSIPVMGREPVLVMMMDTRPPPTHELLRVKAAPARQSAAEFELVAGVPVVDEEVVEEEVEAGFVPVVEDAVVETVEVVEEAAVVEAGFVPVVEEAVEEPVVQTRATVAGAELMYPAPV